MNKQSEGHIPREDFFAWLREGQEPLQFMGKTRSCTTFLKLPHGENVTYLFSATQYAGTDISWNANFEFCGMYFPQTQTLRLAEYDLARAVDGLEANEMQSVEHWLWHINQSVNKRIGNKIADDRDRFSIQTLSSPENIRKLREFEKWEAEEKAAEIFLKGEVPDTEYHASYDLQLFPENCKEDAFIAYFQNADTFLEVEAQKYIKTHKEEILLTFQENDVLRKKYEALRQDTDSTFSRQREITLAIRAAGAKTVSVTVEKDGRELTFRADAKGLARSRGSCSPYNIVSGEDRRKFEELFGKYTEFDVQDITRITYGRAVLYEAQPEQAEEMDIGMTMA